jgi:hypothetical protein
MENLTVQDYEKMYSMEALKESQERFANRRNTPTVTVDSNKVESYIKKVNETPVLPKKDFTTHDFEKTREVFRKAMADAGFKSNANNKPILFDLCAWLSGCNVENQENGKIILDAKKGIFLCGGTGNGKTTLMKILQKIGNNNPEYLFRGFKIKAMSELLVDMKNESMNAADYAKSSWCFDDIGVNYYEVSKIYGNKFHPLPYLIDLMYMTFKAGYPVHVTSNLNIREILYTNPNAPQSERIFKEGFDERIRSRIYEMFNVLVNEDIDRRINQI